MKRTNFILTMLLMLSPGLYAQQQVLSAGGDAFDARSGSFSCSMGLPFYTATSSSQGSVQAGVQQTYRIEELPSDTTTDPEDSVGIEHFSRSFSIEINFYPNPATDQVFIKATAVSELPAFYYTLRDLQGKTLLTPKILDAENVISMKEYPQGIYFLHVFKDGGRNVKSYKIIKQ